MWLIAALEHEHGVVGRTAHNAVDVAAVDLHVEPYQRHPLQLVGVVAHLIHDGCAGDRRGNGKNVMLGAPPRPPKIE